MRKMDEPRRVLEGHSAAVFAIKFDMTKLISGSFDKTVRIWSY
jgi:WD40 repeat protein